jgi:hypothetical protein
VATKTKPRSFHMGMTLRHVQEAILAAKREGRPQDYVTRDGMAISHDDALAHIETMRQAGMTCVPCCENANEFGECQGFER